MKGYHTNIEEETQNNTNFRKVLYTAFHSQLVVQSIKPSEVVDMEMHPDVDQFFRFESGEGKATLNGEEIMFKAGDVLIVPQGVNHEIANTSTTDFLKFYTIYSPPNHRSGVVHATKADAEADEATDIPEWKQVK